MMWLHKWLSSLLLAVLLSGCSLANDTSMKNRAFEKMYSECELNTVVQFLPLQDVEYKTDTTVNLNIRNTSPNPVVFPVDLNLRIIFFDAVTQAWSDIKNALHYLPAAPQILDPADSGLGSYDVISLIPVLSEEIPVSARVVVSGNISDEDGKIGECVGAYTDILITP